MAKAKSKRPEDSAAVWVALLERGRSTGNFSLIQRANRELERLGVCVTIGGEGFGASPQPREGARE